MCEEHFNLKASPGNEPPRPSATAYHIHIYFQPGAGSERDALALAQELGRRFPQAVEDMHRVGKVGPHTAENIGVTISPQAFGEVVSWLQMNGKGLSILVHPRTGDELLDHLEAAMWLGKPVAFNERFFDSFSPKSPKGPAPL